MKEPLLMVVHPGDALNSYTEVGMAKMERIYGKYNPYLRNLNEEISSRNNFIIIPYSSDDLLPFKITRKAEITTNNWKLIERLRTGGDEEKEICGEFLWYYSDESKKNEVSGGCVEFYKDMLLKDFPMTIKRNLCYPLKDP